MVPRQLHDSAYLGDVDDHRGVTWSLITPRLIEPKNQHLASIHQHPQQTREHPVSMVGVLSKRTLPQRASPTSQDSRNLRSSFQNTAGNGGETENAPKLRPASSEAAHQYLLARQLLPEHQMITYHTLTTALLHLAEA